MAQDSKIEWTHHTGNLWWGCTKVHEGDEFFTDVVPASPNLMFLLLTKRPSNINKYIPAEWEDGAPELCRYQDLCQT